MIQMPRRSVTRFFIPLIDVLLLLFCIFLLMPIASESRMEKERESAAVEAFRVEQLERELERRLAELKKFEDLRQVQADLDNLKKELDRLRRDAKKAIEQKVKFYLLDMGPKGELYFFDGKDQKPMPIPDQKTAQALLAKHREEAKGRELYYYFLYPRPETGFPTVGQERQYKTWFAEVGHSLKPEIQEPNP